MHIAHNISESHYVSGTTMTASSSGPFFTIISWNVLADRCLRNHPYVSYAPGERRELQRKILNDYAAKGVDFICLQEVDTGFIAEQVLCGKYVVLNTHWGLASCIFYKIDTWRLVGNKEVIAFNDLARGTDNNHAFRRNNYGVFALFENLANKERLVVCTTHLYWDPNYEYVKLCQAHYLLTELRSFVDVMAGGNVPVAFCGDLNSKPGGLVHNYLTSHTVPPTFRTEGELMQSLGCTWIDTTWDVRHWLLNELHCPFSFCSAYQDFTTFSQESYPFTNVTRDFCGLLDYVFFDPFMLQKKGIVKLPESLDALLEQYGSSHLPSRQWPSDHLIVGAVFSFVIPWLRIGSSAASFKIISWNVLGDHCLGHHPYVKYNSEERRELQRKILNDYVAQGVDFICLQEVDTGFIAQQVLSGKYLVLNTHSRLASCIFYKIDTWRVVGNKQVVAFNDLAKGTNYNQGFQAFHGNNYGVFALFERLQAGERLVVCTTHLHCDPNYEYVKLCQAHYLLTKLRSFVNAMTGANVPTVFCGDLNSKPGSLVHNYFAAT